MFTNYPVDYVYVPDFITEISKGQFDNFLFLTKIRLPNNIKIDDPSIFDNCESLTYIDMDQKLFATLSNKMKKRCKWYDEKAEYAKPIYGGEQDIIVDETQKTEQQKKNNQKADNLDQQSNQNEPNQQQKDDNINQQINQDEQSKQQKDEAVDQQEKDDNVNQQINQDEQNKQQKDESLDRH